MKKKENKSQNNQNNQNNQSAGQYKTIQYLEKKYKDQKQIGTQQIKRLQNILHNQIQKEAELKLRYQKRQQQLQKKLQGLQYQIKKLRIQNMGLNREKQQNQFQEDNLRLLDEVKNTTHQLREKDQQIGRLIKGIENLEFIYQQQSKKTQIQDRELTKIKKDMQELQNTSREYLKQRRKLQKQMENKNEQQAQLYSKVKKLQAQNSKMAKRNAKHQQRIQQLEQRINFSLSVQIQNLKSQLNDHKSINEQLSKEKMQLVTKCQLYSIQIKQLKQLIANFQQQAKIKRIQFDQELKKKNQKISILDKQNSLLLQQIDKAHEEIHKERQSSDIKVEQMKQTIIQQFVGSRSSHFGGLHGKDYENKKIMEGLFKGMRNAKSYGNIPSEQRNSLNVNNTEKMLNEDVTEKHQKFQDFQSAQIYKLEKQTKHLREEISSLKRQNQLLVQDLSQTKKNSDCQKSAYQIRMKTLEQQNYKHAQHQKNYNVQINNLRNQNISLKNKQTQLLECQNAFKQFEKEMAMKIGFYDKKIRDLLQTIERKDQFLNKSKHIKNQSQDKVKFMQEKLMKVLQENQVLKRYKNDLNRKETLVKDYKDKTQKSKGQIQELRAQVENLKKQKAKADKKLQSKQEYIATLKVKHQKDISELQINEKQLKDIQNRQKESKSNYQSKYKKIKKQFSEYAQSFQAFKNIIFERVQQKAQKKSVSDRMNQQTRDRHSWLAQDILDLKSSEIQMFVNPMANMDKSICKELQRLWEAKNYQQFVQSSLNYLQSLE